MSSADSVPDSARGAFWRFSLDFYARPGVAPACLTLQDRHGTDVNLLLFAAWVGWSGRRRLTPADLARADGAIAPWRRGVVEPLRAVRRAVKEEPGADDLYRAVKSAELAAERHAQDRLESLAPSVAESSVEARRADALANLDLYLGPGAASAAAEPLRIALAAS
jgi:uncharacterized protein (TIGR02444 family)